MWDLFLSLFFSGVLGRWELCGVLQYQSHGVDDMTRLFK